jgi:hypothetical protein
LKGQHKVGEFIRGVFVETPVFSISKSGMLFVENPVFSINKSDMMFVENPVFSISKVICCS